MNDKNYKEIEGKVIRKSGDKTVAVVVTRVEKHPMYEKRQMKNKTYLVHDEKNTAQIGATVRIRATRPLSARKRWAIVQ